MTQAQPDGATLNGSADGTQSPNTMRGMAMRPVNPLQVTSMVGHGPDATDEFRVTRIRSHLDETSSDLQVTDHRGDRRANQS
jgi:hypothetical protein